MSDISDQKAADEFEVIWKSGHVDRLKASQVSHPNAFRIAMGHDVADVVAFHADVNGRWTLMLRVNEEDILSIRNVTRLGE